MKIQRLFSCLLVISCVLAVHSTAQDLPATTAAQRGVPEVSVSHAGDLWIIRGAKLAATFNQADMSLEIDDGRRLWRTLPSDSSDFAAGAVDHEIALGLSSAAEKHVEEYYTGFSRGIKIALDGFQTEGRELDLALNLFLTLEGPENELVFRVVPREGADKIRRLTWPRSFVPGSVQMSVVPYREGMLLPRDWPEEAHLVWDLTHTAGLYMPWWGWVDGGGAAMLILETPDDAGCTLVHPSGGPTLLEPRWIHSLGELRYPRQLRMIFMRDAGYVELARRYRTYVKENGHFVSLEEKIARTPVLQKLIGSPVAHLSTVTHTSPDSRYYNREFPERNHRIVTFGQRAEDLRTFSRLGVGKLYVHLDGWGYYGYDRLHPDHSPAGPEAGGWDGLRDLSRVADSLGYVFAIHDQYRDYYREAPSFDERHAVMNEDGSMPDWAIWLGGRQSIICPSLSEGFLRRNHRLILDHWVKLDGTYLDVFACNPMDECYSPEHPVTRSQCLEHRARCMSLVGEWEGVVSSEEPVDWAIPWLDLVHFSLIGVTHSDSGNRAVGIPVPLFSLVYHDAVLVPWFLERGSYGIPATDLTYLHGMLRGGMPYLSPEHAAQELERVRAMCALHRRVALLPLTGHTFLDGGYRRQQSVFADGTTVTVDFDADTWSVSPPLEY